MSTARELDQYFTHPKVAKTCFDRLRSVVHLPADAVFLEPSAGEGAFFDLMPPANRFGFDLQPRQSGIQQQDFLLYEWPTGRSRAITVGNPPFGKNASLAVSFFNHAAKFSDVIAFIVPKTFRKGSLVRRLDKNFVLCCDDELPECSFIFEGQPYSVPCCFQIWKRSATARLDIQGPLTHVDFGFVGPQDADFAVRRVGGLAGKVLRVFAGYSAASHYFIKARGNADVLIGRLAGIDWSDVKANNAGNPSISKREFVAGYSATLAAARVTRGASTRALAAAP